MPDTEQNRPNTQEKKRLALQAALGCFTQHGLAGTTIDMIREASGMSVGSLYHHFGNKEKIAAALYIQGLRNFGSLVKCYLSELPPHDKTAESGVKALVYANVDWISTEPDWARFVFHHRSLLSQDLLPKEKKEDKVQRELKGFSFDLVQWFTPHIVSGNLKTMPYELFSSAISGPTHDYARHWLAGRYNEPLLTYREEFADMAWQSVKGKKQP